MLGEPGGVNAPSLARVCVEIKPSPIRDCQASQEGHLPEAALAHWANTSDDSPGEDGSVGKTLP